jgi:RNA polymerase sigma-70 factor, ECF subfamily
MSEYNDIQLVQDCLAGKRYAFEAIVDKYQKTMFNVALRMVNNRDDAEDITQRAFIKCFENLDSYNRSFKFFSWLYRIVTNEAINFLKSRKILTPIESDTESIDQNPEELYTDRELSDMIVSGIAELKEEYRSIIILKHLEGLAYQEIAEILEIPVKTVKSRLFTARTLLRNLLIKKGIRIGI